MKKHVSRKQSVHAGFAASAMSDSHQGFKSSFKIKLVCTIVCVALIALAAPGAFATTDSNEEGFSSVTERSYTDEEGLSAQSQDLEAATEDTTQAADTATKATAQPESVAPQSADQASYTLYLTHCFQYTVAGKEESIQALEKINLSDTDFKNGSLDLSRFVYETEYAEPFESGTLTPEAFGADGVANAQITYAVRDGWRACTSDASSESAQGISTMSVFTGNLEDITFVPAKVIRVNAEYLYSNTGGLAGTHAASSQTVEAVPVAVGNGQYQITWKLPTIAGFRVVLDPEPLNAYLVNPPTGNESPDELEAALDRGDFNVDVDNKIVYYYQQVSGQSESPTYFNRYSDGYNKAWNEARDVIGKDASGNALFTAQAVGEESRDVDGPGANALVNPELQLTLTEDQLDALLESEDELDVTVFYRRNATWYTVNHWVPTNLSGLTQAQIDAKTADEKCNVDGVDYVLVDKPETLQGRVGAMTNAQAKTSGIYEGLSAIGFSQKIVENATTVAQDEPDTSATTVDIYYQAADSYRVIFDTDYTYIPRQQVNMGEDVNFADVKNPSRVGYEFAGWQYLKKDAVPDANGEYPDTAYEPVGKDGDNYKLTLNDDLLSNAKLQDTGGVLALHLYPIWKPTDTHVRVIFWTEDLTGEDDVQATAAGGDSNYYDTKYAGLSEEPVTHAPEIGESETGYSNVGSFVLGKGDGANENVTLKTGDSLVHDDGGKQVLNSEIQTEINKEFNECMGQSSGGIDFDQFYTQAAFEIVHESGGHAEHDATAASADGKTTIYVYYTRNIYTLQFHYYGNATGEYGQSAYSVAYCTNGYSYDGVDNVAPGGNFNYGYGYKPSDKWNGNLWAKANVSSDSQMSVPQTITIKAKYGADLHDIWPSARPEEAVNTNRGNTRMVSWSTTQGKYRDDALPDSGSSHEKEPTIMGPYGGMSSEIIADPANSDTVHHLVAYWHYERPSYYRYNHCLEVPDLDINSSDVKQVSLYNNSTARENVLYLVSRDNEAFTKYDFDDLMPVSYDDASNTIEYDVDSGEYYAVRGYAADNTMKYYAVTRQYDVVSTNTIKEQNPSAKFHVTVASLNADHTTEHTDDEGATNAGKQVGTVDNPYDLYFYYDRDRYTITYMVPRNNINAEHSEETLGTVTLPYGALVKKSEYGFDLDYKSTNMDSGYQWNVNGLNETFVCPDHSVSGTAAWKFTGWGLGPAGVNMQWTMSDESQTALQDEDDFRISSNLRLYAIWQQPSYTVTFHLNGGTASREQLEVEVSANTRYSTSGTIPRPVRAGYTLDGWYVADENGNPISPLDPFDFDQDVTSDLHAVAEWTAISTERFDYNVYYVTQELNDAEG